jgi:hypothetical protein
VFAAAAALGRNLPANHRAFSKFLADLEPMLSQFICAHPLCPKNPSLEAIHCDPEQFMFKAAPSNNKPRWAASYDPTKKATYCSWFLETTVHFLNKHHWPTKSLMPEISLNLQDDPLAPNSYELPREVTL